MPLEPQSRSDDQMEDHLTRFDRGMTGLHREIVEHGTISHVKPGTVIEDSETQFVLWTPVGTPVLYAELIQGTTDCLRKWDQGWRLVERIWRSEVLSILRPGKLGKTELKWDKDRVFQGWKVALRVKADAPHSGMTPIHIS